MPQKKVEFESMDSRTCIENFITPQSKSPLEKGYSTHRNYKTFCILTPSLTFANKWNGYR